MIFISTMYHLASSRTFGLLYALVLLSFVPSTLSQGDYSCQTQSDCQNLCTGTTDDCDISNNAICVPDPANPLKSYCGYVGAGCSSDDDCDFGTCHNSVCHGYFGDHCNDSLSCLGYLQCGTDKTCGGKGSVAVLGSQTCTSHSATCEQDGTNCICNSPPTGGMPNGTPCGKDSVCASGWCRTSSSHLCESLSSQPTSVKRNSRRMERRYFGQTSFEEYSMRRGGCGKGFTSCPVSSETSIFECINTDSTIESCGGCPSYVGGTGIDCTTIPNVDSVLCVSGTCLITSCSNGFELNLDGSSCVPQTYQD